MSGSRRYSLTELAVWLAMVAATFAMTRGFLLALDAGRQADTLSSESRFQSTLSIDIGSPYEDLFVLGTLTAALTLGALLGGGISVLTTGCRRVSLGVTVGATAGLSGAWMLVHSIV